MKHDNIKKPKTSTIHQFTNNFNMANTTYLLIALIVCSIASLESLPFPNGNGNIQLCDGSICGQTNNGNNNNRNGLLAGLASLNPASGGGNIQGCNAGSFCQQDNN